MKQNAKISNTPHNIDLGKVTAPTANCATYCSGKVTGERRCCWSCRNPAPPFCFPRLLAMVYSFGEDRLDIAASGTRVALSCWQSANCPVPRRPPLAITACKSHQALSASFTTRKTPFKMQPVVDLLRHVFSFSFCEFVQKIDEPCTAHNLN